MQTPLAAEGIEETIRRAINYFCTPEGRVAAHACLDEQLSHHRKLHTYRRTSRMTGAGVASRFRGSEKGKRRVLS